MQFVNKIREVRLSKGIGPGDFAKRLGDKSLMYVTRIEREGPGIKIDKAFAAAAALDSSVQELFGVNVPYITGAWIIKNAAAAGIPREDIAKVFGVSIPVLSNIMRGARDITLEEAYNVWNMLTTRLQESGAEMQEVLPEEELPGERKATLLKMRASAARRNLLPKAALPEHAPLPAPKPGSNVVSLNPPSLPQPMKTVHTPTVATVPQTADGTTPVLGVLRAPDGYKLLPHVAQRVPTPREVSGIDGALGVFVPDDTMEPRYEAGDIVFVNPHRPVYDGDYVVVVGQEDNLLIRQFVRFDGNDAVFRHFTPFGEHTIPYTDIKRMYWIVKR